MVIANGCERPIPPQARREEYAAFQRAVEVTIGHQRQGLEGAFNHALAAYVLPWAGGIRGERRQILCTEVIEFRPVGFDYVAVSHHYPRRQTMGLENGNRHT
nr:hypothetical protein GCM10020185_87830 [Pseudomonas brassicacearum subsp. brassicacearum]